MKKLLLFAAVVVFSFSTAQSQELRLGAKAGVNFASIGGDDTDGMEARTSFHVGVLVEIPISEKFAVQPELLYSAQGAKNEYTEIPDGGYGSKFETNLKLDYINIPIMAKYYIIDGLSIEAGPQLGILVSANSEGNVIELGTGAAESFDGDVKDYYKSIDFAVGLGASYHLNNGVFFSLRFNKGISKINEDIDFYLHDGDPIDGIDYNYKQQNNLFQISAGYSF